MYKNALVVILIPLMLMGCVRKDDYQQSTETTKEEHQKVVNDSKEIINKALTVKNEDIEIMNARNYVADFDNRLDKAEKYIEKCMNQDNCIANARETCTIIAYDMNKFYRNGEDPFQLAFSEKEEYRKQYAIAQKLLSTELKENF